MRWRKISLRKFSPTLRFWTAGLSSLLQRYLREVAALMDPMSMFVDLALFEFYDLAANPAGFWMRLGFHRTLQPFSVAPVPCGSAVGKMCA
jgi:hypothetical protein